MKERTLKLKADVGDRVLIPDLECRAVIIALYVGRYCTTYEVGYFHAGKRETTYLYDHEFEEQR